MKKEESDGDAVMGDDDDDDDESDVEVVEISSDGSYNDLATGRRR